MFRMITSENIDLLQLVYKYEGIEKLMVNENSNVIVRDDGIEEHYFIFNDVYQQAIVDYNAGVR